MSRFISIPALRLPSLLGILLAGATANVSAQFSAGSSFVGPNVSMSGVGGATAIGGQFERAISDRFGIGGTATYWSFGEDFSTVGGTFGYSVKYIAVAGNGTYHFEVDNERFDPFIGGALGYYMVNYSTDVNELQYSELEGSRMFFGAFGGVRYFLKENLALIGRAGVGASYLTVGVDFRF
jgi:hypothetical protein